MEIKNSSTHIQQNTIINNSKINYETINSTQQEFQKLDLNNQNPIKLHSDHTQNVISQSQNSLINKPANVNKSQYSFNDIKWLTGC